VKSEKEIRRKLRKMMEKEYRLNRDAGYEICVWSNGFIAGLMWVLEEE